MFKLRLCKDKLGIKDTYCMSDMIFTFLYVPSIFFDYLIVLPWAMVRVPGKFVSDTDTNSHSPCTTFVLRSQRLPKWSVAGI